MSTEYDDVVARSLAKLGEQMAHMYEKNLLKRFTFSERLKLRCCKCQVIMMNHSAITEHPFFENNLEHLEWKYEQNKLNKYSS